MSSMSLVSGPAFRYPPGLKQRSFDMADTAVPSFCRAPPGLKRLSFNMADTAVPSFCREGMPLKVSKNFWVSQQKACRKTSKSVSPGAPINEALGEPIKDALVKKIKLFQKAGKDEKTAWSAFCDSQEVNNRDPARYPVHVLQQFVKDQCFSDFPAEQGGSCNRIASPKGQGGFGKRYASIKGKENELSDHKSDDQPKMTKGPCKTRKELADILGELRLSRNMEDAVSRVAAVDVPGPLQKEELCEFLGRVSEEDSEVVRKAGFDLVVNLFDKGHWKPAAVGKGLKIFTDNVCAGLKMTVPALPKILREELCPMLHPLVKRGWLTAQHLQALLEI